MEKREAWRRLLRWLRGCGCGGAPTLISVNTREEKHEEKKNEEGRRINAADRGR